MAKPPPLLGTSEPGCWDSVQSLMPVTAGAPERIISQVPRSVDLKQSSREAQLKQRLGVSYVRQ